MAGVGGVEPSWLAAGFRGTDDGGEFDQPGFDWLGEVVAVLADGGVLVDAKRGGGEEAIHSGLFLGFTSGGFGGAGVLWFQSAFGKCPAVAVGGTNEEEFQSVPVVASPDYGGHAGAMSHDWRWMEGWGEKADRGWFTGPCVASRCIPGYE